MQQQKIQLTSRDILNKDFKTALKGYNQEEVDRFLDTIIKDYENFQKITEELHNENVKLKRQLEEWKARPASSFAGNTPDILKRLSNLEKHVFGNKLYE